MKRLGTLIYLIILIVTSVYIVMIGHNVKAIADHVAALDQAIDNQQKQIMQQGVTLSKGIYALTLQNNELQERIQNIQNYIKQNSIVISEAEQISRGTGKIEPVIMRVTAYDLSFASCKKKPDHPEYGITASGEKVQAWHTIAAGPELPFGTKVFIPFFRDKPNKGIFTVEDRGSAIKENCIDVYMESNEDCKNFGLRYLEVYIFSGGPNE